MNTKLDIIISIVLFILIIIYKIYQYKRYDIKYKSIMYYKSNKICKYLIYLSILILLSSFIFFYIVEGFNIKNILLCISMFICIFPINMINLYRMYFNDEEKYSHIRTIITKKIPKKELLEKFEKAKINIVILSKDKVDYKIEKLGVKYINKTNLKKSCIINSDDISIVDKYLVDDEVIVSDNLDNLYKKIYNARGIHDNYIRNIKYIICLYLSIMLGNIVFIISGFPLAMNLSIMLIFKLFNLICNEFIFKDLKYDTDIMTRKVKDTNIFIGKQELFLLLVMSILMLIATSLPYMFLVVSSSSAKVGRSIYFVILIYCMLFFNYYNYSEKIYIINIISSFKSIRMIIYLLLSIGLSLLLSLYEIFYVFSMNIRNYFMSVLIALVVSLLFDYFKFSRWMSNRRK